MVVPAQAQHMSEALSVSWDFNLEEGSVDVIGGKVLPLPSFVFLI